MIKNLFSNKFSSPSSDKALITQAVAALEKMGEDSFAFCIGVADNESTICAKGNIEMLISSLAKMFILPHSMRKRGNAPEEIEKASQVPAAIIAGLCNAIIVDDEFFIKFDNLYQETLQKRAILSQIDKAP